MAGLACAICGKSTGDYHFGVCGREGCLQKFKDKYPLVEFDTPFSCYIPMDLLATVSSTGGEVFSFIKQQVSKEENKIFGEIPKRFISREYRGIKFIKNEWCVCYDFYVPAFGPKQGQRFSRG